MRRARLSAALATLTLAAALATTGTATAAPSGADTPTAAPLCSRGYVCVQPVNGFVTAIPEGSRHDFDPPVAIVSVVNSTSIPYCVIGSQNTGISPGRVFEPTSVYTLRSLIPSPGGICPAAEG
ncbi:hypothetical protein [Streptomyces sp. B5E4]|uniref:hypothetical protein n=1 Tax=Streptomyces sp. B5E4 TaxID=3153568 RepID=UPI00325DDD2E